MIRGLLTTLLLFSAYSAVADEKDLTCLAKNLYFEARDQSFAGQIAISLVVLNRVNDTRFPNTICEVIYEGPTKESWKTRIDPTLDAEERIFYPVRHKCQFSWWCDGKADEIKDFKTYKKMLEVAGLFLDKRVLFIDITEGSTHYHAYYVAPDWGKDHIRVTQIDDHIFYRWEK